MFIVSFRGMLAHHMRLFCTPLPNAVENVIAQSVSCPTAEGIRCSDLRQMRMDFEERFLGTVSRPGLRLSVMSAGHHFEGNTEESLVQLSIGSCLFVTACVAASCVEIAVRQTMCVVHEL